MRRARASSARGAAWHLVLAALAVVAAVAWGAGPGGWFESWFGGGDSAAIAGAPVRRGPLSIRVVESGNLKSAKSVDLVSELERQTTILYLIEEGTEVKAGELLCELDASELDERLVEQQIMVQNAESSHVAAVQQLQIQKSQNQSDLDAAQRKIEFAEIDLEKYREGDMPQQLKDAEDAILLAEEELKRADDKLEWSRKLSEKGFLTRTELEADELSAKRLELKVAQEQRNRDLLVEYDFPKQLKSLEADLVEARHEHERISLRAQARLVDFEADERSSQAKLELEREKLVKLEHQIAKARIVAPIDGMVVYAQEGGRRWGNEDPIQEGTQVRERQKIITIPVTQGMLAEVSLHETVLEQVREGQRCIVTVEALKGRKVEGFVRFKSAMPDQNSWWANPNQRLYRTEIELTSADPEMLPGMSCSVEIMVEDIPDATYVPLQSVFLDGGKPICFVSDGGDVEVRPVEPGANNRQFVEILEGLTEGEVVLLSQPPGFDLAPAELVEPPSGVDAAEPEAEGGRSGGPARTGPRGGAGTGTGRTAGDAGRSSG